MDRKDNIERVVFIKETKGGMNTQLEEKYNKICEKYSIRPIEENGRDVLKKIRSILNEFTECHSNIAAYCYGLHTKMLMSDFMFELKKVKYIVDNYIEVPENSGFIFIRESEIEKYNIDAVIVSSFVYRKDIISSMRENHPEVDCLDIYEKLEKEGIQCKYAYYSMTHPYYKYRYIIELQQNLRVETEREKRSELYEKIISKYLGIKDFLSAIRYIEKAQSEFNDEKYKEFLIAIEDLYATFLNTVAGISDENVLMFCLDGMMKKSFDKMLPKLTGVLEKKMFFFNNAFSYSNSTYESLIPSYSENVDMSDKCYVGNVISPGKCRFINRAKEQNRTIHFYTDMDEYVDDDSVEKTFSYQTVTEKIWDFAVDACRETYGLFYIHTLWESHFSFANPYIDKAQVLRGTAMLFDFLEVNGGKLQTDYIYQHACSMNYLDDVLTPFFENLRCRMVIYADHGNMLLDKDSTINDVLPGHLTFGDTWIRIPLGIVSPEQEKGKECNKLESLTNINEIIISLLDKRAYIPTKKRYIKVARTEIYNPNFIKIYKMVGRERDLLAQEMFIFDTGERLKIFSDGRTELYLGEKQIYDLELSQRLLAEIQSHVSVVKNLDLPANLE